jgi:hypothetical protein
MKALTVTLTCSGFLDSGRAVLTTCGTHITRQGVGDVGWVGGGKTSKSAWVGKHMARGGGDALCVWGGGRELARAKPHPTQQGCRNIPHTTREGDAITSKLSRNDKGFKEKHTQELHCSRAAEEDIHNCQQHLCISL